MKRLRILLPVAFVVCALVLGFYFWLYPSRGPKENVDLSRALLEEIEGTRVLHLKGTPYEMGFQRGVLLKEVIRHSLARFDELLELAKKEVGLPKVASKLILDIAWRLCSPHIPQRYQRELEGVADGAEVSLQELRRIHVVSVITERGCSSFAVWGKATADGKLYHGRNFDWIMEAGIQDTAVLVCYEPQGLNPFVSAGYACAIGVLSGMNMKKVSVAQIGATNKDRRIDGIPLEFLLRRILEEASNLDEVTNIIKKARHTVGYNYVIADGDENRALVYETCANHVAIFKDNDPRETVEYAIPIENAVMRADEAMDQTIRALQTCANAPNLPYGSNSYDHRYKGMATRIKENYGRIDQKIALEILKAVAMVKVNLHSVLYCPTDLELWVAHAKGTEDAAKQTYVHYKMVELFDTNKKSTGAPVYFSAMGREGEYIVDTGFLKGIFRPEGKSLGFEPLELATSNTRLSNFPGILNFYRVFKTNYRFGDGMRDVKSEARFIDNRSIEVVWKPSEKMPFELTSVYRWKDPKTLDLLITVKALVDLPKFEIFLSSYLTEDFPEPYIYVKDEEGERKFVSTPPQAGTWQAFPRDKDAIEIIRDGRWTYPPSPVDWVIRECFAEPIIYRRDKKTGLAIIKMALKEDCFSIMAPHIGEAHYSMYFSLFGKDLKAGESASTKVRLVIDEISEEGILKKYEEFLIQ
ncbi:MAG: C45 family autoproteolytic acyltransferase/hydrolase [Candidatus Hydrogenedentes bacterium]|nr:C45 family autoproteolytic acyltransferase/hydrolase [Candidatus Hydrogenedentota bacterium]